MYSQFTVEGWPQTVHMYVYSQFVATNSTHVVVGWPQTVHMFSQFVVVGWPQTVHVTTVLHAVASCALLAQLV